MTEPPEDPYDDRRYNAGARYQAAQKVILSTAFATDPAVLDLVPPSALDRPWRDIAAAIQAVHARGATVDLANVNEHLQRAGQRVPHVLSWYAGSDTTAAAAVEQWQHARAAVHVEQAMIRARQRMDLDGDLWETVDGLRQALDDLERPTVDEADPWWTTDDVVAFAHTPPPEVIPGLLAQRERAVIVGAEGYGKSMLCYQIALGAAYGVHPFDPARRFDPQPVMVLDVENTHESQVASIVRRLDVAYRSRTDAESGMVLLKRRTIDLLKPGDRQWLVDTVGRYQPTLLVMGAGYKLVDSVDWREVFQAITRSADACRAVSECAVLIETHAGHGKDGDRNGWRPDGSSSWLRWPEFGLGLAPVDTGGRSRLLDVVRWRGDRTPGRDWPAALIQGGALPWSAMTADEWECHPDYPHRRTA